MTHSSPFKKKCGCLCHWIIKNYSFYNSCLEQSTSYLLLIHTTAQKFHPCANYTILNSSSTLNSRLTKDQSPGIDWALQGAQIRRGRTSWKPFPPLVSNLLMIAWGKYWKYCFCVKFAASSCQLFTKPLFLSITLEAKHTQATVIMVGIQILLVVCRAAKPLIVGVNPHPVPLRQVSMLSWFYRWGESDGNS